MCHVNGAKISIKIISIPLKPKKIAKGLPLLLSITTYPGKVARGPDKKTVSIMSFRLGEIEFFRYWFVCATHLALRCSISASVGLSLATSGALS
ncbi:hypothetical protein M5D96_000393, partial [Drosophila gunungcola]